MLLSLNRLKPIKDIMRIQGQDNWARSRLRPYFLPPTCPPSPEGGLFFSSGPLAGT